MFTWLYRCSFIVTYQHTKPLWILRKPFPLVFTQAIYTYKVFSVPVVEHKTKL